MMATLADRETFRLKVRKEILAARGQHPPMQSLHQGLAILWEEFEEVKAEVFKKRPDLTALVKELVQVAAMAECMAVEVATDPGGL